MPSCVLPAWIPEVNTTLANLKTHFPAYAGQGYELAGFIWFQGWNDMISAEATAEYAVNLKHFIHDVRKEFKAPKLPFVIGEKKTNELLFTGEPVTAAEAERLGLVNRVVPGEELEAAIGELVRKIAPTPLPVLKLTKLALVRAYASMGLRAAVESNLDLSAILNAADTPEGREFNRIAAERGLKAALAWRDGRYGDLT